MEAAYFSRFRFHIPVFQAVTIASTHLIDQNIVFAYLLMQYATATRVQWLLLLDLIVLRKSHTHLMISRTIESKSCAAVTYYSKLPFFITLCRAEITKSGNHLSTGSTFDYNST